jgi:propionate catabolism operon transcriptional regulator
MTKLVFLSYGKLTGQIKQLKSAYPDVKFEIIETTLDKVLDDAKNLATQDDDTVFISSGANAKMVFSDKKLKLPMIEICSTGYDFLQALREASTHAKVVGIITFQEKLPYLAAVKDVFNVNVVERTYHNRAELEQTLDEFLATGIYDVIGSSMVGEYTARRSMRDYMLWTEPAIRFAIDNAVNLARVQKATAAKAQQLKTILDFTHEGIVVTDQKGVIEVFNAKAEKITGINSQFAMGRHITEVIENTKLDRVILEKKEELNQIQTIGDAVILTNRVPVMIRNKAIGAVATFQHVDMIQKAEEKIRSNLYTKGFIAQVRFSDIIGRSKEIEFVKQEARLYSQSDSTILIKGQSGSGKDYFAQSIHNSSPREIKPYLAINCAALPMGLLESELFGYEDGAFTGAKRGGKHGVFEMAHTGTLFLDEIADIPLPIQALLLRVLEQKEILRIGGQSIIKVDVRIIAATNKDLWQMVLENKFREDLYYRLNVLELRLPPLKDRREDIPLLATAFLRDFRKDLDINVIKKLTQNNTLLEYDYSGNIRELKNIIERFCVLYNVKEDIDLLIERIMNIKRCNIKDMQERTKIQTILDKYYGSRQKTAKELGISRTTLWRRSKELGLTD